MSTMTAMTTARYKTTWLRPDFADVPEQMVGTVDIAHMAEVGPRTALAWSEKYDDFPDPVREVHAGRGVTRTYLVGEVARWLLTHRPQLARGIPEEERMAQRVQVYHAEVVALQEQLDRKRVQRDAMIEALQRPDTPDNA